MTAYGYGERDDGGGLTYTCEIRTLNSRYLEVNVRLPRHLLALEVDVINHVKAALRRGKADVFLDAVKGSGARDLPTMDADAVRHVLDLAKGLADRVREAGLGDMAPPSFGDVARVDGVMVTAGGPARRGLDAAEAHKAGLFQALDAALAAVAQARRKEGAALAEALRQLLDDLEAQRQQVAAHRDQVLTQLRANVLRRVDATLAQLQKAGHAAATLLSEERLAMEVTLASDKADIDEELTRLATHVREFHRLLGEEGEGRKLDFLCQEMHREVNTMSNKLVQTEVSQHTLEMKQIIERIRQQVQNLE